jgi:hypothetical protein
LRFSTSSLSQLKSATLAGANFRASSLIKFSELQFANTKARPERQEPTTTTDNQVTATVPYEDDRT